LDYHRDEQQVHLLGYHLIWCPKRRSKVLVTQIGTRCEDLLRQTCDETGWTILELAVQPDHVHLFVRVWPSVRAADVVKECNGVFRVHAAQGVPGSASAAFVVDTFLFRQHRWQRQS